MCWNSLLNALNSLGSSLSVRSNNLLIWNYVCKKYLNEVKKTDPINGDNKNLHSSEYAKNVMKYLGIASKEAKISMYDY